MFCIALHINYLKKEKYMLLKIFKRNSQNNFHNSFHILIKCNLGIKFNKNGVTGKRKFTLCIHKALNHIHSCYAAFLSDDIYLIHTNTKKLLFFTIILNFRVLSSQKFHRNYLFYFILGSFSLKTFIFIFYFIKKFIDNFFYLISSPFHCFLFFV